MVNNTLSPSGREVRSKSRDFLSCCHSEPVGTRCDLPVILPQGFGFYGKVLLLLLAWLEISKGNGLSDCRIIHGKTHQWEGVMSNVLITDRLSPSLWQGASQSNIIFHSINTWVRMGSGKPDSHWLPSISSDHFIQSIHYIVRAGWKMC